MANFEQPTSPRCLSFLKSLGLVVGCLAKFVTGSLFVFNVYAEDLKTTFNFTQKEVELQSSLLNLGLGAGFLPGLLYDKLGPTWTSGAGLVVSVSAYLLLWSTTKYAEFYGRNSWLMALYFFVCGIGSVFTYMVALNTNIINFHSKHRGLIVGVLNSFFAGSPSIFSVIYYKGLTGQNRFGDFMLLFAVSFAFVDILCIIFLRIFTSQEITHNVLTIAPTKDESKYLKSSEKYEVSYNSAIPALKTNGSTGTEEHDFSQNVKQDESENASESEVDLFVNYHNGEQLSIKQLLCNENFHLFTWMFVLAASVGLTLVNNITIIAKSLHLNQYNGSLVLIVPITTAVMSILIGVISDLLKEKIPRMSILVFACACFVVSQAVILIFGKLYVLLILGTFLCGLGISAMWTLCPAVMSELFSLENIGRNWGIAILLAAVVGLIIQLIFGTIYDAYVVEGTLDCYGMKCINGGIGLSLTAAVISVSLGAAFIIKNRRHSNYVQM
ncbi:unnamed protein product [Mytilus coruscus]|uniref:Major facilitator superfamily (MFS) profile domain-containing protein n=1 Tax=Mytilus coruscus TaxID=42192 RepID=A0A6J8ABI3_MYTCO|nr:unnamed protein product [Mytilus coruscus]